MATKYGYEFYFKDGSDVLTLPITPSELTIEVGSKNKVITLINEGDVNILKSPSLIEVKFDARFPMRQYPYARQFEKFETYWNKFKELKESKKPFRFIVARTNPRGVGTWDTNILVALEEIKLKESVDDGDDVIVTFNLKQFKEYGVRTINLPSANPKPTTSTSTTNRNDGNQTSTTRYHTVTSGDTLWKLARKYYGDATKWSVIYTANVTVIEQAAKSHGKQSSSTGRWIYSGTKLTIPAL